jgi:hypothetical protein
MKKLKEILKHLNIGVPKDISTNCKTISDSLPEGWCHHNVFTVQQKYKYNNNCNRPESNYIYRNFYDIFMGTKEKY